MADKQSSPGVSDMTGMLTGKENPVDLGDKGLDSGVDSAEQGMDTVTEAGDKTEEVAQGVADAPGNMASTAADDVNSISHALNDFGQTDYTGDDPMLQMLNDMVKMASDISNTFTTLGTEGFKSAIDMGQDAVDKPMQEAKKDVDTEEKLTKSEIDTGESEVDSTTGELDSLTDMGSMTSMSPSNSGGGDDKQDDDPMSAITPQASAEHDKGTKSLNQSPDDEMPGLDMDLGGMLGGDSAKQMDI